MDEADKEPVVQRHSHKSLASVLRSSPGANMANILLGLPTDKAFCVSWIHEINLRMLPIQFDQNLFVEKCKTFDTALRMLN